MRRDGAYIVRVMSSICDCLVFKTVKKPLLYRLTSSFNKMSDIFEFLVIFFHAARPIGEIFASLNLVPESGTIGYFLSSQSTYEYRTRPELPHHSRVHKKLK